MTIDLIIANNDFSTTRAVYDLKTMKRIKHELVFDLFPTSNGIVKPPAGLYQVYDRIVDRLIIKYLDGVALDLLMSLICINRATVIRNFKKFFPSMINVTDIKVMIKYLSRTFLFVRDVIDLVSTPSNNFLWATSVLIRNNDSNNHFMPWDMIADELAAVEPSSLYVPPALTTTGICSIPLGPTVLDLLWVAGKRMPGFFRASYHRYPVVVLCCEFSDGTGLGNDVIWHISNCAAFVSLSMIFRKILGENCGLYFILESDDRVVEI